MPPPVIHFNHGLGALFSFILPPSLPSPIALLPSNSIARILTFGPWVTWKDRFTVLLAALTGVTSGLTSTYS